MTKIFTYSSGVISRELKLADAPSSVRVADISFLIYDILVEHIKDGRTSWPVVTGNSLLGFFAQEDGVYNTEEYAKYIEGRNHYIEGYARGRVRSIVREALELLDVRAATRRRPRDFDYFVRQLSRIAALTRGVV